MNKFNVSPADRLRIDASCRRHDAIGIAKLVESLQNSGDDEEKSARLGRRLGIYLKQYTSADFKALAEEGKGHLAAMRLTPDTIGGEEEED